MRTTTDRGRGTSGSNAMLRSTVVLGLTVVLMGVAVGVGWADGGVVLEEPVKISARTTDRERVVGQVTGYDAVGFDLLRSDGKTERVGWDRLSAKTVFGIHQRIFGKGTAEQWFGLGVLLLEFEGAGPLADKSFGRAKSMDPAIKGRIDQAIERHRHNEAGPTVGTTQPGEASDDDLPRWHPLSAQEHAEAISQAKKFAREAAEGLGIALRLVETKYYLVYTDLPDKEARHWASTLDKTYVRLCRLFALPPQVNIYRGKAQVYVFVDREDFGKFEMRYFKFNPVGLAIGVCHQKVNGDVVISFFRQANKRDFAGVLVHESAHGFVYRYRSRQHIPTWSNEGLAEWISRQFGPRSPQYVRKQTAATKALRKTKSMGGDLFTAEYISPTQYGIAADLTDFMIRINPKGYASYINGIKDGQEWRDSLEENFGLTVGRLVEAYGQSIGVADLRE